MIKRGIAVVAIALFVAFIGIQWGLYQLSDCPSVDSVEERLSLEITSQESKPKVEGKIKHLPCIYTTEDGQVVHIDVYTHETAQGPLGQMEVIRQTDPPPGTDMALSSLATERGGFAFVIAGADDQTVHVGFPEGTHFCEAKLTRPFENEEQRNTVGGLLVPVDELASQACEEAG